VPTRISTRPTPIARPTILKCLALAALCAATATPALAAGSISGRVTNSATSLGMPGVALHFYDLNADDYPFAIATTDANGDYVQALPAGTYGVLTQNAQGFINEIWNNVSCSAVCDLDSVTPIEVTASAVTGIDFALSPGGGRISGTVTATGTGLPIAGVQLWFADANAQVPFTTAITDGSGNYLSDGGSVTGNVFVMTRYAPGYQNELYNDIKCWDCDVAQATPVAVTLGLTTTGINFGLDLGGRISGSVRDASNAPLANVQVKTHDAAGNTVDEVFTDASGNFSTSGLPAGTHYVRTRNIVGLVDKVWTNLVCARFCNPVDGTPISVAVPATTSGIDFVLPPGGTVGGTVTAAAGGAPIAGEIVNIVAANGTFVGGGWTDATGAYTVRGLPTGTYFAVIFPSSGFVSQLYNNISCGNNCNPSFGTPILVVANQATPNINFSLLAAGTGSITGTVTDISTGLPLSPITVQLFTITGGSVGNTPTDASGVYTFSNVAAGSYYVRTNTSGQLINQVYNGVVCILCPVQTSGGTLVTVTNGGITGGINFALAPGGRISGTITNSATGLPIQNIGVQLTTASGVNIGNFNTNASGVYTSAGLPAGTYYVRTVNNLGYINKQWNNLPCPQTSCFSTGGTPVVVAGTATTGGIDFSLTLGGTISGTLTNAANGDPIPFQGVQLFNSTGLFLGSANTNASGNYTSSGLAPGTYYSRTATSRVFIGGQTLSFIDELYNNNACVPACLDVTAGTPINVTAGAATSGINFALSTGGAVAGAVIDAGPVPVLPFVFGTGLGSVVVQIYTSSGDFAKASTTNAGGGYVVSGLPPGTYFAKASLPSTLFYLDELYDNLPCGSGCDVTTGTPITVTGTSTAFGVDFVLTSGAGGVSGTVTDNVTGAPLAGVLVQVFTSGGVLVKVGGTNAIGGYGVGGLAPGTYYARTARLSASVYIDELYGGLPCAPACTVTDGTPIVVAADAVTTGVDFVLAANMVTNGQFANGTTGWLLYATPDMSYIVSQVTSGVFEYYRVPPPPGTSNQAVVFQTTGIAVPGNAPVVAQFDIGNSSAVRKRISVLVLDASFTDLAVCTFWLPPGQTLKTYQMKTHSTQAWTNASIYFYAASAGSNGGFYQLDNVTMRREPTGSAASTECVDPNTPAPPGGPAGPELLVNGDFGTGTLPPWGTYGTIVTQIANGVLEFIRPNATPPAGVVLQATGQPMTLGQLLTAAFQLGNSSGVRKRVTVLVHDNDFSDLFACTFFLSPGQALGNYVIKTFTTEAWTNATLSIYAATVGPDQWIRLDNASLKRTPSAAISGVKCLEPGSDQGFSEVTSARQRSTVTVPAAASRPPSVSRPADVVRGGGFEPAASGTGWMNSRSGTATATLEWAGGIDLRDFASARLTFDSWLTAARSEATVEVSAGSSDWMPIFRVPSTEIWSPMAVDLTPYAGAVVQVRLVFDAQEPSASDFWHIDNLQVELTR